MNVVSSSGDVLHHHHTLNVSVGGTDEEEIDAGISPDEEGRTRRRPARGQSRIEFERLAAFFHVPINEAAKGLGVCATVLKKVCRKHGIPRWPHRKIKKLDTMLAMLETAANKPGNPQHDDDVRKKMEAVMRDRAVLMTEGKLVGEGKSENRRSKADGKRDRKRKKIDDDDEDEHDVEDSRAVTSSYTLVHNGSEQDIMQASNQGVMMPMNHQMGHLTTMEMGGYHIGMGSYTPSYGTYTNANGLAIQGNGYSYNSLFWNGAPMGMSNISLPSVHSISSGVISSTAGMMMHNLPPPLSAQHNLSMATPISPLTPIAPPLSSSNPLPIPLSHSKHPKLSHSDVLLDTHHFSTSSSLPSSSPYSYHPHRSSSAPHLAYSDFSVQQDPSGDPSPSSHFRLFDPSTMHAPTTASE
jgi:hypothetical protein